MIIDAHAHIFPAISGYTGSGETRNDKAGAVRWGDGTVTQLLPPLARDGAFSAAVLVDYMDMVGVDRAVLLQGPFYGPLNDYVYAAVDAFPDRLIGCGVLDPFVAGSDRLYERVVGQQGFRNLKFECSVRYGLAGIHPNFDYLDPRWERLWERVDADGLTVVIDTGEPGTISFDVRRLAEIADRYLRCRIVIAHLGFPPGPSAEATLRATWEPVLELGQRPNVWFDLAGIWAIPGDDYPCPVGQGYVQRAVEAVGASRLIWGTDIPGLLNGITYQQAVDFIATRCSFLSQPEKQCILGENAAAVYQERA